MSLTNDQITAQNFKEFYGQIRPYLNGNVPTFANTFNKSDLYSTDEQLVGRWIDGKPLYQKVINYTSAIPDNTITTLSLSSLGITGQDNFFIIGGFGYYNLGGTTPTPMAFPYNTAGGDMVTATALGDNLLITMKGTSYGLTGFKLIVQYTKTNDSQMSISDGNEYSTDEQIVGKWVDGSPLYQKTYIFAPVQNSNSLGMTIDSTKLVNYFGLIVINDGNDQYSLPINCIHPDYQNLYGIFTHVLNDSVQVRTLNNAQWKLSNMKQLKITIQYLK